MKIFFFIFYYLRKKLKNILTDTITSHQFKLKATGFVLFIIAKNLNNWLWPSFNEISKTMSQKMLSVSDIGTSTSLTEGEENALKETYKLTLLLSFFLSS